MARYQLRYSFEAPNAAEARKMLFSGFPPLSHTIRRVDRKVAYSWIAALVVVAVFWTGIGILICSACQRSGVRLP